MNKTIILRTPSRVIVSGVRKLGPVSNKYLFLTKTTFNNYLPDFDL